MNCRSFRPCSMGFITHRVDAARVDPPVVEIEQCADGNRIVDGLVGESSLVESRDVRGLNGNRIVVHLSDKVKQNFLRLGEQRCFDIGEHARHQLGVAEQFRRDRGVGLRSKGASVQVRRIRSNQFTDSRRKGRRFAHHFLRESLQVDGRVHLVREHMQDLRIFRSNAAHHFYGAGVVVVAPMLFYIF